MGKIWDEIKKDKEKQSIIFQIIELDIKSANEQGINHTLFIDMWRNRLNSMKIRELKKELKLKQTAYRYCKCFPNTKCDSMGECGK